MVKKTAKKENEINQDVRYWLSEISSAKKREKDYLKDGQEIMDIYAGKKADQIPFNILFSNTETLLPALFSQTPRPVVQRRFKDADPIGKAASMAAQRMLEYLCDTNVDGYETFELSMSNATLDGLLPGRGNVCVKYDAEVTDYDEDSDETPVVKWEQVCTESKMWNKAYFGYAKKWSKVPWIAYEEYMDEEEAEQMFGDEVCKKIVFSAGNEDDDDERGTGTGGRDDNENGARKTALIYQIWDKAGGRKIKYISPAYADGYLKEVDDPLEITGFYNCPRPLQFIKKSDDLVPTAMYKLYENQAKELNRITVRIQRIVEALKVRGVYDSSLGSELDQLLKGDDNELIPTDKSASLAAEGGLERAIWFMPLEKLIVVLQNLINARENAKRVIYEITGISDIIRGQSMASETLGAQKIKESWGTLRMKRLQKEVQRYARDTMRIMVEIAAKKFSEQTWALATGLPYLTQEQLQQGQAQLQAMQAAGQPPTPELQQMMQTPIWEGVLKLLKDDMQRSFHIDIETNSTIDVEATEDQKNIGDFMNAMGQLLAGLTPMIEKGSMPFEAAQSIMLAVIRKYRFGPEVEDQFKNMKQPKPKDDGKAEEGKKQLMGEQQKTMQAISANERLKIENTTLKSQMELGKREVDLAKRELAIQMKEANIKHAIEMHDANLRERDAMKEAQEVKLVSTLDKKLAGAVKQNEAATKRVVDSTPAKVPQEINQIMQAVGEIAEAVNGLGQQVQQMAEEAIAPVEYERGGDGKVMRMKKGARVMNINRDELGRMTGVV